MHKIGAFTRATFSITVAILAIWAGFVIASVLLPFPVHPEDSVLPGKQLIDDFNHQQLLLQSHARVEAVVFLLIGAGLSTYLVGRGEQKLLVWSILINPILFTSVYLLHILSTGEWA